MKLVEVARALSSEVSGDGSVEVRRPVHPADAEAPGDLAVALTNEAFSALAGSRAGAAIVPADAPPCRSDLATIPFAGNERVAVARLTALFDRGPLHEEGIHPSAAIAASAAIGEGVSVGPYATVGAGATIGAGTVVLAGAAVGVEARLGAACVIHSGAVIGDRVVLGDRVIVHANAVIGADGFSFVPAGKPEGGAPTRLPLRVHSLGTVVIGDDVEIGAGTTIDRATLRATRIGRGTKIDNQVQIGHNVSIGESCLICGKAGIAGSVVIGDRVLVGAAAGLSDHITVGSDASVGAMAGVGGNVGEGVTVFGFPAVPLERWYQRHANLARLTSLYRRVEGLQERLATPEKADAGEQEGV
jgi:UDP-3-O-[3-hydroxymyristoyl] glucosamine N-acyltransferase